MFASGCATCLGSSGTLTHRHLNPLMRLLVIYRQRFKDTPASSRLPAEQPPFGSFGSLSATSSVLLTLRRGRRERSVRHQDTARLRLRGLSVRIIDTNVFSHVSTAARASGKDLRLSLSFIAISGPGGRAERTQPLIILLIMLIKIGGLSMRLALD